MSEAIFAPCSPKQALMLECNATLTVLGGSAGSAKSYSIILDPLQYVHDPNFEAIVFRRTGVQLRGQGGLWKTARSVYSKIPEPYRPRFRDKDMMVVFPVLDEDGEVVLDSRGRTLDGASIKFSHFEHEKNILDHQGLQYSAVYFDEGTHFTWTMVEYLMGRLRSGAETNSFMKISCNPDPDSFLLDFLVDHYLDEDGLPIEERAGDVRWYVMSEEVKYWADTPEELLEKFPTLEPTSFSFVPATIKDNPILRKQEPMYEARLKALNPIDRARLYEGNWLVRPQGSSYANRSYFQKADRVPLNAIWCRPWDKAGREFNPNAEGSNKWPDYTASVKMGRDPNGDIYLVGDYHESNRDQITGILGRFRKRVGPRDNCIMNQANYDGKDCVIILPKDPSSAGIAEFQESCKKLNEQGFIVKADPSVSNASKLTKFLPFCSALENGNIYIVESTFEKNTLIELYKELEKFDGERSNAQQGKHDDWVDAIASGYNYISQKRPHKIVVRNQKKSESLVKGVLDEYISKIK